MSFLCHTYIDYVCLHTYYMKIILSVKHYNLVCMFYQHYIIDRERKIVILVLHNKLYIDKKK